MYQSLRVKKYKTSERCTQNGVHNVHKMSGRCKQNELFRKDVHNYQFESMRPQECFLVIPHRVNRRSMQTLEVILPSAEELPDGLIVTSETLKVFNPQF